MISMVYPYRWTTSCANPNHESKVSDMDIGTTKPTRIVEPIENPIPERVPERQPERVPQKQPATPAPVKKPVRV